MICNNHILYNYIHMACIYSIYAVYAAYNAFKKYLCP